MEKLSKVNPVIHVIWLSMSACIYNLHTFLKYIVGQQQLSYTQLEEIMINFCL